MIKYAKIINNETGLCEVGLGTNSEYYKSIGMTELGVEISEKDNQWYLSEKCPHYTPEEKEAIERQRLDALTLTPADVERALYKAKQMDFEDLKALIVQALPTVDIKALSIEFRAKDFYRGAMAGGMRLFDVVGALLGYTPDDIDYLFENKELPEKEEPTEEPEPVEEDE
jgi:hypothetical protein